MNCYACATHGENVPAVATCTHCGIGICLPHFQAEQDYRIGGTTYGCRHDMGSRSTVSASTHRNGHTPLRVRAAR
jgi:hypothetical protein